MSTTTPAPAGPTTGPRPAVERRAHVRYRCMQSCLVWPDGASAVGAWSGMAYNISRGGIGMALPYPVQVCTVLVVEPWGRTRARAVRARVVRCVPMDFVWFHGCALMDPLSEEELQAWRT